MPVVDRITTVSVSMMSPRKVTPRSMAPVVTPVRTVPARRTVYTQARPVQERVVVREEPRSQRSWAKTALIVGGSAASGAGLGAVLGGILGALGLEWGRIGDSPAVQIASWALFGLIGGALLGGFSAITVNEDWQLTFARPDDAGPVSVAVRSEDAKDVDRAAKILRDHHALGVSRSDSGRPAA